MPRFTQYRGKRGISSSEETFRVFDSEVWHYELDCQGISCYSLQRDDHKMKTKFTLRLPHRLLDKARRYALAHHTTLTRLITAYLEQIPNESDVLDHAPIVRRLTGLLSPNLTPEDYEKHLEEKYG